MINIFEKYNKLTDEEKADLEDLYIVHQLLKELENIKELDLGLLEKKYYLTKLRNVLM